MLPSTSVPDPARVAPAKRVLWKWSAAVVALLLVFLMWRCGSALVQGRKLADAAVKQFHERLNAGNFEEIYRDADEGFRGQNHDNSIKLLEFTISSGWQEQQLKTILGSTQTHSERSSQLSTAPFLRQVRQRRCSLGKRAARS